MLYTGKGDDGTTKTFDSTAGERVPKSDLRIETLGVLDELNSFLGLCKVASEEKGFVLGDKGEFEKVIHATQDTLFTIQAEMAGAPKSVPQEKTKELEECIAEAEKELPPIQSFFVSGGTELAARFDVARTMARRAERRVTALHASGTFSVSEHTRSYMNRLSSLFYALARLSNHKSGIKEEPPQYN